MPPGIGYINPQIIMQAMQRMNPPQRGPIDMIAPRKVGSVLGRNAPPPSKQQQGPGGISGFLQRPGIADALLATGSALLAQSDSPGSLGGALGRALPVGIEALRSGQQRAALDDAFADAPESMRRLMAGLSQGQRQALAGNLAMSQMMPPPPPERTVVGNALVDEATGRVVYQGQDTPSAEIQALEDWRAAHPDLPPGEQMRSFYEARRGAGTTVNVGDSMHPVDKTLLEIDGNEVRDAIEQAESARDRLAQITEVERLLDEGVQTGAMEDRLLGVRQIANAFGVGNADELIRQENFQALGRALGLEMTNLLEGQISETELGIIMSTVPSLGMTPESNRRLVETWRRAAETAIDVAEAKRRYFRENRSLDGFEPVRRRIVQEQLLDRLPQRDSSTIDPDTRMQELADEGKTVDEIIEIGRREGWIG